MSVPAVRLWASDSNPTNNTHTLQVPELPTRSAESDISDDDSILNRCETDSMTSESESESATSKKQVEVIKQYQRKESNGSMIPTRKTAQHHVPQGQETANPDDTEAAYDGKKPPVPRSIAQICEDIVGVLARYRLVHKNDTNKPWGARSKFLDQVEKFVARQQPVLLSLPAFPFKSPNKATKVLGALPDKGEEVALSHLQGLCLAIKDVYEPGADVFIVSDGLVYNGKASPLYRREHRLTDYQISWGSQMPKSGDMVRLSGKWREIADATMSTSYACGICSVKQMPTSHKQKRST